MNRRLAIALVLAASACGGGDGGGVDARQVPDASADASGIGDRPFDLFVPSGYVAGTAVPLVVLLHGYSVDGAIQESYFMLEPVAEAETFLYATPNGTIDGAMNRYWNATDGCCDIGNLGVDDVGYLSALIDDVVGRYTVDPKRIYFVGHSNGGFMSHRMACEAADRIAAIVSLAGTVWNDPVDCAPSAPVAVAQVHGTADDTILYTGGQIFGLEPYPGAETTVATWRGKNGCTGAGASTMIDLDAGLAGAETTVTTSTGCMPGGAVELWAITGGGHIPNFDPSWPQRVWDFFAANPKP